MENGNTPVVCGGVYERTKENILERAFMLCSATQGKTTQGWLQRFGHAKEIVVEGSEEMNTYQLVGTIPDKTPKKAKKTSG